MGLKVLAFAFISNMIGDLNVSHDSVLKMAKQSGVKLNKVISNILSNICMYKKDNFFKNY